MKYTPVHAKLWADSWFRQLNALDRYLFLYLLTNGRSELTGIYELPMDLMAAESGIDERDLRLTMLPRLEPKIYYREGWVMVVNYQKYRTSDSPQLIKGIQKTIEALPSHIKEMAISYGYDMHMVSIPYDTRLDKIRLKNTESDDSDFSDLTVEATDDNGDPRPTREPREVRAKYEELARWAEARRGFPFVSRPKQYAAMKKAKAMDISVGRLKERWQECESEGWRDGFDWTSVVSSFDKKA